MEDDNQDCIVEDNPEYIPDEPVPENRESVMTRRNNVEFENQFDYKPLPKGIVTRVMESVFKVMRRKKPVPVRPPVKITGNAAKPLSRIVEEAKKQAGTVQVPKQDPLKKTPGMIMKEVETGGPTRKVPVMPGTRAVPAPTAGVHKPDDIENKPYPKDPKPKFRVRLSSISKLNVLINGIALLLFAAGAYILYSELPTRPELIAGIVLVSCASGVLAGRA